MKQVYYVQMRFHYLPSKPNVPIYFLPGKFRPRGRRDSPGENFVIDFSQWLCDFIRKNGAIYDWIH